MEKTGCGWYLLGMLLGAIFVVAFYALEGAIIMWLWNWLGVALFTAEPINFWIGCGIAFALNFIGKFFRSRTVVKSE